MDDAGFGAAVYRGGARLTVSDRRKKLTSKKFIRFGIHLDKSDLEGSVVGTSNKSEKRRLLIKACAPDSKAKANLVLKATDFRDAKNRSNDAKFEDAAGQVEIWLGKGGVQPNGSVLSYLFGEMLCASISKTEFKLHNDPGVRDRYETDLKLAARKAPKSKPSANKTPRQIKLVPHGPPSPSIETSEDESEDDDISRAFETSRKMRRDNLKHTSTQGKPTEISFAELAVETTQTQLVKRKEGLEVDKIVSSAREHSAFRKMNGLREKTKHLAETNRAYKVLMNEALQTVDLSEKMEAKAKRDKVRHVRELARIQRSCLPFKSAQKWQKGTVIGPGPLPLRAIALQRDKPDPTVAFSMESNSKAREQVEGQCGRLVKAFNVIRSLAKTYDSHYLDFQQVMERFDPNDRGYIRRKPFEQVFGALQLTLADYDLLWGHFDRDKRNFIEKDELIWGFYNQRQLLKMLREQDEAVKFRAEQLSSTINRNKELRTQSRSPDYSVESIKMRVRVMSIRGLTGLDDGEYNLFCIASCCQVKSEDGEEVIVISQERRSGDSVAKPSGNNAWSSTWTRENLWFEHEPLKKRKHQRLLLECRAYERSAASDVHSIFIGELFAPIIELDAETSRYGKKWYPLRNGDHGGEVLIRVELSVDMDDIEKQVPVNEGKKEQEPQDVSTSEYTSEAKHRDSDSDSDSDEEFVSERRSANAMLGDLLSGSGFGNAISDIHEKRKQANSILQDLLSDRIE